MSMPQYRHYLALLDLFKLKPSKESKEFGDLAMFMAQVRYCVRSIHTPAGLQRSAESYLGGRLEGYTRLSGSRLICDCIAPAAGCQVLPQ